MTTLYHKLSNMRVALIALTLLLVGLAGASRLAPLIMSSPHGTAIKNQFIVVFKESSDFDVDRHAVSTLSEFGIRIERSYTHVFKGLSVRVDDSPGINQTKAIIKLRGVQGVKYIEQDGVVQKLELAETWGLDRIDQRQLPLNGKTHLGDPTAGSGVNAYIIDTGIFPEHEYFSGRAQVAFDAVDDGLEGIDCNGHGTHCAGTVGADHYGIARGANLFGVKVLDCYGSGSWSGVVAGMDWVAANASRPAVASMSLGGGGNNVIDDAVTALYQAGIPVSVAAGNSDDDACQYSPARAKLAITVGATDHTDYRAFFSSKGSCLDIFAPGVNVLSTWIGSTDSTNTISGTSMACPHVTGAAVLALYNDPSLTPEQVWNKLEADATCGVLQDKGLMSPDKMLYIPHEDGENEGPTKNGLPGDENGCPENGRLENGRTVNGLNRLQ